MPCTVNAGNVIIVWSSVQCETVYSAVNGQAGTLWMEGIMWPQHLPEQIFLTDCQQAHTRDQPIKTIPKCDLKWARRVQKNTSRTDYNGSACVVGIWVWMWRLFNAFLWMEIVICKWVWLRKKKNGIFSFSTLTLPQSTRKGFSWKRCKRDLDDF